jgi:DNA invertase Pin-like site-specific DNA recombinase
MAGGRFIAYYRVSTARQGRSGLGLEGQRGAVAAFLIGGRWQLLGEFTEVESGANNARPELAQTLNACRLKGAALVIAKLDRLSRDAHFLLGLEKAGVDFVAADMPNANRMTVGIMAVIAEQERCMIAARTRAALAAAKARGVVLGGWKGGLKVDGRLGADANKKQADAFAAKLAPVTAEMQSRGLTLRQMAAELTAQGIRTPRGGQWSACAVRNVLLRLALASRETTDATTPPTETRRRPWTAFGDTPATPVAGAQTGRCGSLHVDFSIAGCTSPQLSRSASPAVATLWAAGRPGRSLMPAW